MKAEERPLILAVNDDGITSPGIQAMVEVAQTIGEVVVVAPDRPQSAMGHAITIDRPLRLDKVSYHGISLGYQCSGTPVDCVKIAIDQVLHRKPDLVISGINHGANHSINVIYSGTMSAAMEGAIEGIPSIAFSLLNYSLDADLTAAKHYVKMMIDQMLLHPLPKGVLLNVNVPDLPLERIKGVKVCRQADAKWEEEFDERTDPHGGKYYWLTGEFVSYDNGQGTDVAALSDGFVSVVPVQYDLTAHKAMEQIGQWDFEQ